LGKLPFVETELTESPEAAARFIRQGGVVAFPTETVYGLGADVFNEIAVAKIFDAKRRPPDNPLIAHIGEIGQMCDLAANVPDTALKFADTFFPGPLTLVLDRSERVPLIATAGLETIGVRMPRSLAAIRFLRACGTPVAAPSANISGRPSPTTWQAVFEDLAGRIDCILQGEAAEIGLESTVVDCTGVRPVILRAGAVSIESLRGVVPETIFYDAADDASPRSPGMRHKHYAPVASVILVDSPSDVIDTNGAAYIGLDEPRGQLDRSLVCVSAEDYARNLFSFFRDCDNAAVRVIYCQKVTEAGIGTALMDRLRRAAAG